VINDKPAGLATKIQKKAYRANTQSNDNNGLKIEQYSKRPAFLNHTRTPYNIINPCQEDVQSNLSQAMKNI